MGDWGCGTGAPDSALDGEWEGVGGDRLGKFEINKFSVEEC